MAENLVYVVVYGAGDCIEDVHGVFAAEERAELACTELQRVYDNYDEWAAVHETELVMDGLDEPLGADTDD